MKDEKLIVLLFAFRYAVHRIATQTLRVKKLRRRESA